MMILFLDFDGVTHEYACKPARYFHALPLIESVVREFTPEKLAIVVSSNWRNNTAWSTIVSVFAHDIAPRVIGFTPQSKTLDFQALPLILSAYPREAECTAWMRKHRPAYCPWLAIDDEPAWFQPFCPNLMTIEDCTTAFEAWHVPLLRKKIEDSLEK